VSDLDAALESVRDIREGLEAERRNNPLSETLKRLQAAVAALHELAPAPANGASGASGADWDLYERNQADIGEIVTRLRNGAH
jgi:hypothetical protein